MPRLRWCHRRRAASASCCTRCNNYAHPPLRLARIQHRVPSPMLPAERAHAQSQIPERQQGAHRERPAAQGRVRPQYRTGTGGGAALCASAVSCLEHIAIGHRSEGSRGLAWEVHAKLCRFRNRPKFGEKLADKPGRWQPSSASGPSGLLPAYFANVRSSLACERLCPG
jgi:hypothetical protein